MAMQTEKWRFILQRLPLKTAAAMENIPPALKEEICEIRLKENAPVMLTFPDKTAFLSQNGRLCEMPRGELCFTDKEEISDCFLSLCNRSVYAHEAEIREGYLAVGYGCRAGICGRFSSGKAIEVSSINLRISHDVKNCSGDLYKLAFSGLLIAGPPSSGKTTVLRDVVRSLSSGKAGKYVRVCVVDTREEITVGFDMGFSADSIISKDKSKGIETALRTMSPQIIAFDEIGTPDELDGVKNSLNAGVGVVTTAHAGSIKELKSRGVIRELLESGAVRHTALLSGKLGEAPKIYGTEEILGDGC